MNLPPRIPPPAPAPLPEGLKMVPKCNGELNRVTLKTLLSLKFRVGKPTGLVRATDSVGLPAQWIFQGHHSLFHTYLLFYFRVLTAIRDVSPPPPVFRVTDKYHLPQARFSGVCGVQTRTHLGIPCCKSEKYLCLQLILVASRSC